MSSVTTLTCIVTILVCNHVEGRANYEGHDKENQHEHVHGYQHNDHRHKGEWRQKSKDEIKRVSPECLETRWKHASRMFKTHNSSIEKKVVASLERILARERARGENIQHGKHNNHTLHFKKSHNYEDITTLYYRPGKRTPQNHHHGNQTPPIDSDYDNYGPSFEDKEVSTSSSGILHVLEERHRKLITGDSEFYDRAYYDSFIRNPPSPEKSISSDYASWEKYYEDLIKRPDNYTTAHYDWWTYDPNETCEWFNGRPLNINRMLYSIKMSTLLPANISAEIDAEYDPTQPDYIDSEFARKVVKSREEFAKTANVTNKYRGPDPNRRELDRWELLVDDIGNKECTMIMKMKQDLHRYVKKPLIKGLYHFKKWMNPNYFTTTPKIDLTWGDISKSEELIRQYKNYLKVEKNISVPDDAGKSIFEKYVFTDSSNYYDESKGDLPQEPPDSNYPMD